MSANHAEVSRLMRAAAAARAAGRVHEATEYLKAVVARSPGHAESLNALGVAALSSNDAGAARAWFARAAAADVAAPALWLNLAKACRLLNDDIGERDALDRALAIDARNFIALVRKAELQERQGDLAQAAVTWGGALAVSPPTEQLPLALSQQLARAREFVQARTQALSEAVDDGLAKVRDGYEPAALRRFDTAIDATLGRRRIYHNECHGLHFPFLPADEFFAREHFPWLAELEAATPAIRAELERLLHEGDEGFAPYVAMQPGLPPNKWSELDHSTRWSAYFLWKYGAPVEQAHKRCPATIAALAGVPRAEIPGRAPSAFFSILQPRTRIPPHTGVSNTRAIIHLPLIVPEGCGFRVGGETRLWREGEAFAFDDTIEHEAWNESNSLRAVLIFDVWNPHLTKVEQTMLQRFYSVADASGHNPEPREV
jgi:aspartyl/asparaginyl beta-hydroxylase (cupin superfamily)